MIFSILRSVQPAQQSILHYFHPKKKLNSIPFSCHSPSTTPLQPQATTNLLEVSTDSQHLFKGYGISFSAL